MKKYLILLVFLPMLMFSCAPDAVMETTASDAFVPDTPNLIKTSLPLHPKEDLKPNGGFTVSLLTDTGWETAGEIQCDRFYRNYMLELLPARSAALIRIRITQNGGGAAHIDSVSLNGHPPDKTEGPGETVRKLSGKEQDVLDVSGKTLELEFTRGGTMLELNARVENKVISESSHNLPPENLYRKSEDFHEFYSYNKGSGGLSISEFCNSGSGHPDGLVYIDVQNDAQNLYIDIDFTPDNTLDGGADYAKVFIKTADGLKEFTITSELQDWGRAEFIYTEKAPYQHKVYRFTIPLSETGGENGNPIDLAFSLYGTSAVEAEWEPALAYNSATGKYLLTYRIYYEGNYSIYGQMLNTDGSKSGSRFLIDDTSAAVSCDNPAAAYNAADNEFLVVWSDNRGGSDYDIYGQIVPGSGNLSSPSNFAVDNDAGDEKYKPAAAWDSVNNSYLVVWETSNSSGDKYIEGQLVSSSGTLSGSDFLIDNSERNQEFPDLTFNPAEEEYFVVWYRDDTDTVSTYEIYGNLVSAAGSPSSTSSTLNTSSQYPKADLAVAYNPSSNDYLVVWNERDSDYKDDIYGRIAASDGTPYAPASHEIVIKEFKDGSTKAYDPDVAYDAYSNDFIVVWRDDRNTVNQYQVYGRRVEADGSVAASDFKIDDTGTYQLEPVIATVSAGWNYLIAFTDETGDSEIIIVSGIGNQGAPVLVYPADGAEKTSRDMTFVWAEPGIPPGISAEYSLYLGTDKSFTGVTPLDVTDLESRNIILAGIGLFGGFLTAGTLFRREKTAGKWLLIIGVIVLICSAVFSACTPPDSPPVLNDGEASYTVTELEPRTTYYWKVICEYSNDIDTESAVRSFTTY